MILIVEDDEDIRDELASLLRSQGHEVATAEHGLAARAWLKQSEVLPKIILLDLMMPVMDGWQFRAEMLQDAALANIPVLVLSGAAEVREEAAALAAAGYVTKPFKVASLFEAIQRTLSA